METTFEQAMNIYNQAMAGWRECQEQASTMESAAVKSGMNYEQYSVVAAEADVIRASVAKPTYPNKNDWPAEPPQAWWEGNARPFEFESSRRTTRTKTDKPF